MKHLLYVLCSLALLGCESKSTTATPVEESSQMERVRGPFVTQTPPVYDDPGDALVHETGHFQQDQTEPPTEMTPAWANMTQGEIVNLQSMLGAGEEPRDNQLADLFDQGTWGPLFVDDGLQPLSGITYDKQDAVYVRTGRFVYISGVVEWTPSADSDQVACIQLPFRRVGNTVISGAIEIPRTFVSDSNLPDADRPSKRPMTYLIANEEVLKFRAVDGTPLRRSTNEVDLVIGTTLGSKLGFWAIYQTNGVKQLGASPARF